MYQETIGQNIITEMGQHRVYATFNVFSSGGFEIVELTVDESSYFGLNGDRSKFFTKMGNLKRLKDSRMFELEQTIQEFINENGTTGYMEA